MADFLNLIDQIRLVPLPYNQENPWDSPRVEILFLLYPQEARVGQGEDGSMGNLCQGSGQEVGPVWSLPSLWGKVPG